MAADCDPRHDSLVTSPLFPLPQHPISSHSVYRRNFQFLQIFSFVEIAFWFVYVYRICWVSDGYHICNAEERIAKLFREVNHQKSNFSKNQLEGFFGHSPNILQSVHGRQGLYIAYIPVVILINCLKDLIIPQ